MAAAWSRLGRAYLPRTPSTPPSHPPPSGPPSVPIALRCRRHRWGGMRTPTGGRAADHGGRHPDQPRRRGCSANNATAAIRTMAIGGARVPYMRGRGRVERGSKGSHAGGLATERSPLPPPPSPP